MTTITVSEETHIKLVRMKNEKLTSIDKVIIYLLDSVPQNENNVPHPINKNPIQKTEELEDKLNRYEEFERDIRTTLKDILSRGPLAVDFVEDTGEEMDSYE